MFVTYLTLKDPSMHISKIVITDFTCPIVHTISRDEEVSLKVVLCDSLVYVDKFLLFLSQTF